MRKIIVYGVGGTLLAAVTLMTFYWFLRSDHSLDALRDAGKIRVGVSIEAPFVYLDENGNVTGESAETARTIAARLGIPNVVWVQMEFGSLIAELEAGRIDVIAAGMFITAERAQQIAFSEPTFHVGQGLLVRAGNPRDIHSYQEFVDQKDLKVAVVAGSIEENLLRQMGVADAQIVAAPDALTAKTAVVAGVVDGLALSSPTLQWMVMERENPAVEVVKDFEQPVLLQRKLEGYGGFGFRKEDTQLLAAWNAALREFIGSAEHLAIYSRFGFSEAELPGEIRTEEIINQ